MSVVSSCPVLSENNNPFAGCERDAKSLAPLARRMEGQNMEIGRVCNTKARQKQKNFSAAHFRIFGRTFGLCGTAHRRGVWRAGVV
jgi:hypothetical protein